MGLFRRHPAVVHTIDRLIASNREKNATRPGYRKLCVNPKKLRCRLRHPDRPCRGPATWRDMSFTSAA